MKAREDKARDMRISAYNAENVGIVSAAHESPSAEQRFRSLVRAFDAARAERGLHGRPANGGTLSLWRRSAIRP
jgi:hypothetical protein